MGLRYASTVGAPAEQVVAWHRRPGAIRRLVPPWQPLEVVAEAPSLEEGRAVLRLPGGLRWVAQHRGLRPGDEAEHGFVDELVSLPLRWRHTHGFEAVGASATRVSDAVDTPVPGRFLLQTFRYRQRQLGDDLAAHARSASFGARPSTVAVTGSSGLVGSALCAYLSTGGYRVVRLVRGAPRREGERRWDPLHPEPAAFEGVDAVVHLAGASIAGRFTRAHKQAVRDSRVGPTRAMAAVVGSMLDGPGTMVVASAIGFYGPDGGDEPLTEESRRGTGFLADVVGEWEAAARPARDAGKRVVNVRTGIVQSARGGSLALLRRLFTTGLGGPLAPGSQWVSWIGLDDLLDVYGRSLGDEALEGPLNAVAPEPVTNRQYARILAGVLHRPALVPVPPVGPRLLLGAEGARELVGASQRVEPDRLAARGHLYRHPTLEACLRHELGHVDAPLPGESLGSSPS